jgi:hypothetical protein
LFGVVGVNLEFLFLVVGVGDDFVVLLFEGTVVGGPLYFEVFLVFDVAAKSELKPIFPVGGQRPILGLVGWGFLSDGHEEHDGFISLILIFGE